MQHFDDALISDLMDGFLPDDSMDDNDLDDYFDVLRDRVIERFNQSAWSDWNLLAWPGSCWSLYQDFTNKRNAING